MFQNIPTVVKNLIIINVLMFLACQAFPLLQSSLEGYYFTSQHFKPWQIVTHMFLHADFSHIFFNMYALFLFGTALERFWGAKRFLIYYMVCGIGAFFLYEFAKLWEIKSSMDALSMEQLNQVFQEGYAALQEGKNFVNSDMGHLNLALNTGVLGASGAVFGVLLGFGMLFPNTQLMLLFPPIPIKAKWFVLGYGVIEFLMAVRNSPDDNVAHFAHLGGMLFGFILIKYWQRSNTTFA